MLRLFSFLDAVALWVGVVVAGGIIGLSACGKDPVEPPPPPPSDTAIVEVPIPSVLDLTVLVDLVRGDSIVQQEIYGNVFVLTGDSIAYDFLEIELPPPTVDTIVCWKRPHGGDSLEAQWETICGPLR